MSTEDAPYFPKSLQEAIVYFADKQTAFEFALSLRWPDGVTCPFCGSGEHSFISTRQLWKCKGCKKQFSVRVGTIFEDSPIALSKWFVAIWMLANCKNGVSSYELSRAIRVTQKTAWFMLHRVRAAIKRSPSTGNWLAQGNATDLRTTHPEAGISKLGSRRQGRGKRKR